MEMQHIHPFRKTTIASALAISLGTGSAGAEPLNFTGSFTFIDATGEAAPPDTTVTGILDPVAGTGNLTTQTPFNGYIWIADVDSYFNYDSNVGGTQTFSYTWTNKQIFTGTAVVSCRTGVTIDGCTGITGQTLTTDVRGYSFDLTNPGQFGAGVFFDWSINLDIPVLATFQVTNDPATSGGVLQVESFDGRVTAINPDTTKPPYIASPDGIVGNRMLVGPFPNQTPAFKGTLSPATCSYTVTAPLDITDKAITGTGTATINIGTATVTDIDTGDPLPASALLAPDTPLVPGTDNDFTTGVSTIIWDKLNTTEIDCEDTQLITVHDWIPPSDVTVTSTTPATGIDLGTPTDLGGASNPNGVALVFTNDAPAEGFGAGTTVVTWTATDDFGGTTTDTQNVTVNLPGGIVGTDCEIDLDTVGDRLVEGRFTMRDPTGAISGSVDNTVTGSIDTTKICDDESCADVGATFVTDQPFFGELWVAEPIRLFKEGTWTFEACLDDGSTQCTPPTPLSMTVNPGQLGAHMLFEWSVNKNIDVVVVWDVGCGLFELTTTDPDGDGILGTKMVDGPFIGFNAAFDINTQDGEPPIAEGGYEVSIPAYKNPSDVIGASPLPLPHTVLTAGDMSSDSNARRSCVGNCYGFETDGVLDGDGYQYVQVVLPITEETPDYSIYKKYDPSTDTWSAFVINDRNNVKSAPLSDSGLCPEPGDGAYDRPVVGSLKDKLRTGDRCIELVIEDNGPNDFNPAAGIITDPGGVAEVEPRDLPDPDTSGGCTITSAPGNAHKRVDWWIVGGFLALIGYSMTGRRKKLH